jgi:hypothetical protein
LELLRDGFADKIRTLIACPLGISTGMFEGIFDSYRGFFNIQAHLAPILTPDVAVSTIHTAIVNGEQEVISCHPGGFGSYMTWATPTLRLLPIPIQDLLMAAGGALRGMDTFVGHAGKKKKQ